MEATSGARWHITMQTRHIVYAGLAVGTVALAWWLFRDETPQEATQRRQREFTNTVVQAGFNATILSFLPASREQPA